MSAAELLERDAELASIQRRLERTVAGEGGLILLQGSAGSGKTALLRHVRETAPAAGLRVLQAVGGELEREFSFGLVRQLFEPVVMTAEPTERERLLSGAAAAAGPVVGAAPAAAVESGMDASFATLHGLYGLVAALAETEPLLLVVDDAHWGDAASLRFIDFLARRVIELPVCIALGMRPNEPGAEHELLARLADGPEVDVLRPAPLSADAVRQMVDAGLGQDVDDEVVTGALDATRGNPLLIRELVRSLSQSDVTPTAADVRDAVPSSVSHSVNRRLSRLPDADRRVAHALAVLGDRVDRSTLDAAVELGSAQVVDALDALRATELVEDDPPRFVHPLVRQAVAERVPSADRDGLHRRAALALRGRPDAQEEMIVHILAAPSIGEEWVVDALRAGARRALNEGAPDAALRRLRRAVDEYGSGPEFDALQLETGRAAASAGDLSAERFLGAASESDDAFIAAEAAAIQTTIDTGAGELPAIIAKLRRAIDRLGDDAEPAVLDQWIGALINAVTLNPRHAAERGRTLEQFGHIDGTGVLAHLSAEAASGDQHADVARELARRCLVGRPFTNLSFIEYPTALWALTALGTLDGGDDIDAAMQDAEATTLRHPTPLGRGFTLFMRAEWALLFDSISRCEADIRECMETFSGAEMQPTLIASMGTLASALVLRGDLAGAEEVLAGAPPDTYFDDHWSGGSIWPARAELRLAQGRPKEAVAALRLLEAMNEKYGWTRFMRGHPTSIMARALAAAGETEEARTLAEAEVEECVRRGTVGLECEALLALALVQEDDERIATLQRAVEVAGRSGRPILVGRAELDMGSALRRANKRTDARAHLAIARDTLHRIDATGLLERATEELTIAGGRPRRIATSGVDALSPSERRVAEHAARGLSNREIAETLFVTRKTVEFQLGATYQKLGIRSRTQLAGILGIEPEAP